MNIVPYTIAKLLYSVPKDYSIDFDLIWKKQELYPSLNAEIEKIAKMTNEFIQKSNGVIVTEYCKKEDTWNLYKQFNYSLSEEFLNDLVPKELVESKMKSEIKDEKLKKEVNIITEIYNLGSDYWQGLLNEGIKRNVLSYMEVDLLKLAVAFGKGTKIPSDKQAKYIWKIKEKLDNVGVLV